MDIRYLIFLQGLRDSAPDWINSLMQFITDVAGGVLILFIPMIIYFCIDKKKGEFIWLSVSLASVINVLIKNIFCVYRPWIRSELIKPAEKAISGAGDYSFPSSHTQGSASSFGSISFVYRKKKVIPIICIFLVLLVAFTRNYLGVHTPQDVFAGILIAVFGILLANFIQKRVGESQKKRMIFYGLTVVSILIMMLFVCLKKYPVDYDTMGNILYDPLQSISSFAGKAGLAIGFLTAWVLEEKYIAFYTDNLSISRKIVRAIIGIALYFLASIVASKVSSMFSILWLSAFIKNLLMYFSVFFFAPLAFTKLEHSNKINDNNS